VNDRRTVVKILEAVVLARGGPAGDRGEDKGVDCVKKNINIGTYWVSWRLTVVARDALCLLDEEEVRAWRRLAGAERGALASLRGNMVKGLRNV